MKRLFLASQFSEVTEKFTELVPIGGMRVAVIPTAADPYAEKPWLEKDIAALNALGYDVFACDLKDKSETALYEELRDADLIFVGGGNTFYLLHHARLSGFDRVLPRLLEEGAWYIGSSAGSVFMGPTLEPIRTLDDADVVKDLESVTALGYASSVILPHYGNEKYKKTIDDVIASWKGEEKLLTLTDEQALVVTEDGERLV